MMFLPCRVWLVVALLQVFAKHALSCGMTTHTEVAHRAEGWFDDAQLTSLLRDNTEAFEAGAPFPDWGYSCTYDGHRFSDESEAAHWGFFLNNFTQHVLDTYGAPDRWQQSAHARAVVAFLFGLRSHQVADVVWHWGPTGSSDLQGFLRSESHYSSSCLDSWNSGSAPTCHTIGDVGGDLVLGALKLAGNVQTWTWTVPVADVVAVYRRMGSSFDLVTHEAIAHCVKLLYAGRAAVWSVGAAAVPHFSSHAAFMEQELHEFVYGGLEDMAMQTADAWEHLAQVFRGEQPMPPPFNPPALLHSSQVHRDTPIASTVSSSWLHANQTPTANASTTTLLLVTGNADTPPTQPASDLPLIIAEALADSKEIYLEILNVIERERGFTHLNEISPFVWGSGATFREQMGVSISSGNTLVAAVSTRSLVVWTVEGKFLFQLALGGRSVAIAETTGDGIEDVLVATRNGSVVLVDGRTMTSTVVLQASERAFATRLDVSDCDGDGRVDLLVSSPQMASMGYQRGAASVYVASPTGINWLAPTWAAEGTQDSQWFGRGLACAAGHVIVGSPGWRGGRNASFEGLGMVQTFQLGHVTPDASVEGQAPQQQFGFSVAVSGSTLLVGSPGHSPNASTFAGKVDVFSFPFVALPAVSSIDGDQPFARFGMTIVVAPSSDGNTSVLAVGQPHRKTAVDGGNHGGAVAMFLCDGASRRGDRAFRSHVKFDCQTSACMLGGSMRFVNASYILFGLPLASEYGQVIGLSIDI